MDPRYRIDDPSTLLSPSLVIFRDLVLQNIDTMIAMAGSTDRLRPHVKTHKMPAVIKLLESKGIRKHKCATIAEAEMVAQAGGRDILLAYELVGPNIARLAKLARAYPSVTFRTLVDHPGSARALSAGLAGVPRPIGVLLDLEVGMGRTGIDLGDSAAELYAFVDRLPNLAADGLHAYDGHIRERDLSARREVIRPATEQTLKLRDRLLSRGLPVPRLVLGGTPTFPVHAAVNEPGVELSPGTCILHDMGYSTAFPDLPFTPAAALLTRVISNPRPGRICLDLGHKAVAADPPAGSRLTLLGVADPVMGTHNEEHLIVDTPQAPSLPPGSALLALPTHICPCCALHRFAYVIDEGRQVDTWTVAARDRILEL
jgi:D-serine deaminase-like pyridoxal phosphate-dependent protein